MSKSTGKYTWNDVTMDTWLKNQVTELRKAGIKTSTASASKILHDHVLVPNNVNLAKVFPRKPIKLKFKRQKRTII